MGSCKSNSKREVYGNKHLHKKNKNKNKKQKPQINNLTLHFKELEKEKTKPKVSRRKKIIKIIAEKDEIETKKKIEKTNETKSWFF